MPRLKKGSAEAKAYMAKIRSKKSGRKKTSGISRKANTSKYDFKVISVKGNSVIVEDQNGRTAVAWYKDKKGMYLLNKNLEKQYFYLNDPKKSITGLSEYNKAPVAVKKLVDSLEFMYDPNDIKKVVTALAKKGYYIEMSMDGSVEVFRKIKPKAKAGNPYYFGEGKKVTAGALKVGQSYEWILGAEYLEVVYIGKTASNKNIKSGSKFGSGGYLFQFSDGGFTDLSAAAVVQNLRTIPSKVGYKADRLNIVRTASTRMKDYLNKGYSRRDALINANKDAANIYGTKKNNLHKDTKSHNVNIKVVSGMKKNKNLGAVYENAMPTGKKMYARIDDLAYVYAGNMTGSGKLREYLKENANKWVEIDTKFLFSDQYNTMDGYRIYDTMINAIKNDARQGVKQFENDDNCCFLIWKGIKPVPLPFPENNKYKIGTYTLETMFLKHYKLENSRQRIKFLYWNKMYFTTSGIGYKAKKTLSLGYPISYPIPDNVKRKVDQILNSL